MKKVVKIVKGRELGLLGRPVNPNSKRQIRLAELAKKREMGILKKGRPIDSTSNRQKRLAELEIKRANGTLVKGRPINMNSKRQQRLLNKAVNDMVLEVIS